MSALTELYEHVEEMSDREIAFAVDMRVMDLHIVSRFPPDAEGRRAWVAEHEDVICKAELEAERLAKQPGNHKKQIVYYKALADSWRCAIKSRLKDTKKAEQKS